MPRKHTPNDGILEALNRAQHIAFAPIVFQAVRAAFRTGFLRHLCEHPCAEQQAAEACHLSEYAASVLADMLVAAEVLSKSDDGVLSLTKTGECLLFDEMTKVNFNFTADVCYRGMDHLTEALTQGRPAGLGELGQWETIYPAISVLPEPARSSWFAFDHYYSDRCFGTLAVELRNRLKPRRIFDVGGNTGKFACACLQAMPETHVTLIDLPPQCAAADGNPALAPFSERFSTSEVDWLEPERLPQVNEKADVIWMSQFLDCFSEEQAVGILQRCRSLLTENGRFAVLECLLERQQHPAATFSLAAVSLYFTAMANGNSRFFRGPDLERIFARAGLAIEERLDNLGVSHTLYILKPSGGNMP